MKRQLTCATIVAALLAPSALAGTGSQVWTSAGCGGCHTLSAAGSTGEGGPNLDQLRPSKEAVVAQVTQGGGGMPAFGGTLSAAEIEALASYVADATAGTNRSALSAGAVRSLQRSLARLGFFRGPITGFYGPLTSAAVKRFQRSAGLQSDGVWGPKSQAALRAALKRRGGATG